MIRQTLHELYANHTGKISDKWSLYLSEYDRVFEPMRDRPVALLEIGVQNGGSLEIWSQFFPKAQAIIGCDINPDCERLTFDDPRIGVIVGDANDSQTQQRIRQRSGQFDIVIDDGSHLSSDIVKTFALYFPHLTESGIFIAEDLHCGYWDTYEGGLYYPYSSITFFKRLADVINHEHWGVPKARGEILRGIFGKYGCELAEESLALVHSVEFINSMCVVRKSPAAKNDLGVRLVVGALELVQPLRERGGRPYELDPAHDQSKNVWTNRSAAPEEMFVETVRDLGASVELNLDLKQRNEQLSRELDEMVGLKQKNEQLSRELDEMANLRQRNELLSRELGEMVDLRQRNERLSRELDEMVNLRQRNELLSRELDEMVDLRQRNELPSRELGEMVDLALRSQQSEVLDLKQRNDQLTRELDDIRRSTSWRIMAIPRLLVTRMRSLASDAPWAGNLRRIPNAGEKSLRRAFSRSNSTTVASS